MIKRIIDWYIRTLMVISKEKAVRKGLFFRCNIYGDLINKFNCRSFYVDDKKRVYRVNELNE